MGLALGRLDRGVDLASGNALFHDAHRLPHLLHAHEIAVVAVPVLADWDVKIERGIALVGLWFAQIPSGAGTAHHDAGKAPTPRRLRA